jgi:hypothetical protein
MNRKEQLEIIASKDLEDITFEEFQFLLGIHDWTYMYSDDFRYWRSGETSWSRIRGILEIHEDDPKWQEAVDEASPFVETKEKATDQVCHGKLKND